MRIRTTLTHEGDELYHVSKDKSVEVVVIPPENAKCASPARNPLVALRLRPHPGSRVVLTGDGALEFEPFDHELSAILYAIAATDSKIRFETLPF